MLTVTFLLGNGFDIGLGLNTRDEDFYPIYCQPCDEDSRAIRCFKEVLKERTTDSEKTRFCFVKNWSDFEKAIGEYSAVFSSEGKKDFIEIYEDFCIKFNAYLELE